jgi:hypothetical protein
VSLDLDVPGLGLGRHDDPALTLLLWEALTQLFGRDPDDAGPDANPTETSQPIVGPLAEGGQRAGQADERTPASAEMVGLQGVGLIEGTMALVATGAVGVGATQRYLARGRPPGLGPVVDEAGIGRAVRADDAGPDGPLFWPESRRA